MSRPNKSAPQHLIYEGSVKRLWESPADSSHLWFEFTDDYSIFDWGKMPDTIGNKGKALTFLGAYFFELLSQPGRWRDLPGSAALSRLDKGWLADRWQHPVYRSKGGLAESGLASHFLRLVAAGRSLAPLAGEMPSAGPVFMEVLRASVPTPQPGRILGHDLYFYPDAAGAGGGQDREGRRALRLVPLEVVFRFGMPEGSSLAKRLERDPDYYKEIGLDSPPAPSEMFARPVLEFFTKLEPVDRLLSLSEAALLSGLDAETFEALTELTFDIALFLLDLFAAGSLELGDGKLEFVVEEGADAPPRLLLADSIGPDELRLIYRGSHLSKELVRQIYKGSDWAGAVPKAKQMAAAAGRGWKEICREELGLEPEPMAAPIKEKVDMLYGVIANHVSGQTVFDRHPSLDRFVEELAAVLAADERLRRETKDGSGQRESGEVAAT